MKRITSTKEPWIFPALMQKIQYHSHLLPHLHARQTRVIREIKRANACIGTSEVAKLHAFYGLYACLARVMYGNCTRVKRVLRVNIHERYCSTATHDFVIPNARHLKLNWNKNQGSLIKVYPWVFNFLNLQSVKIFATLRHTFCRLAYLCLRGVFPEKQNILHYLGYIISHRGNHVWQTVRSRRGLSMTRQWRDLLEYSMTPEENLKKIQTVYLSISTNVVFIKKRMQGLKKCAPGHISDLTACISQLRQKHCSTNLYNWFSRNLLVN